MAVTARRRAEEAATLLVALGFSAAILIGTENVIHNSTPMPTLTQMQAVIQPPAPKPVVQPDTTPLKIAKRNIDCLARNVYHEARGESLKGQYAVAEVTMRRAETKFGGDACAAVYEPHAFSWTLKGEDPVTEWDAWRTAWKVAAEVYRLQAPDFIGRMVNYYNPHVVHPRWARGAVKSKVIGHHRFVLLQPVATGGKK